MTATRLWRGWLYEARLRWLQPQLHSSPDACDLAESQITSHFVLHILRLVSKRKRSVKFLFSSYNWLWAHFLCNIRSKLVGKGFIFLWTPSSLHSPSLHSSTMDFCSVWLSPCYYLNCEGHSVMWVLRRFVGIANPIIKACVVHPTGVNARIDRRPPAHLNCAHLLQYKRQQQQIPLVALPNVNSQDEQWNEHYPHFLSWRGGRR